MRLYGYTLLFLALVLPQSLSAKEQVIADFSNPKDQKYNWVQRASSKTLKLEIAAQSATESDFKLKTTFISGKWPGFSVPVPQDWSAYEALRFEVHTKGALNLQVRLDDPGSTSAKTRFGMSFALKPGRNLCQIEVKNIAERLNVSQIKKLILFTVSPPKGLVIYIDNITLGNLKTNDVAFIPYEERKDLQPKMEIVTPHFPYAKNLAGGPLKTFFLTSITEGREVVELKQRMDYDSSTMHWDRTFGKNTWGMGDFYGKRGHKTDYVLMQDYLTSSMQGPEKFDTMFLFTPQGWNRFGKAAQEAVTKRVHEKGEGLIFVFPFPGEKDEPWPASLQHINALIDSDSDFPRSSGYFSQPRTGVVKGEKWRIVKDHPITRGISLDMIPFEDITIQTYKVAPDAEVLIETESGVPVLAIKKVGKGRVATFAWRSQSLTPLYNRPSGDAPLRPYRYWESVYSLMNRAAMWTAQKEFKQKGSKETLVDTSERAIKAHVYRNAQGKVTDWEFSFTPPAKSTVQNITAKTPEFIDRGQKLSVEIADVINLKKTDGMRLELLWGETSIGTWRTLAKKEIALTSKTSWPIKVSFSSENNRQILGLLKLKIFQKETLLAEGLREVVVTPQGETWDDFELLMWPVNGLPFLREKEDTLMKEFGSTGVMDVRWQKKGQRMRWARAGLRLMAHNLSVRPLHLRNFDKIKQEYTKTKNKELLIRKPSYADDDFLAGEVAKTKKSVALLKPYFPTNYILCDEPSYTSFRAAFDFDFHPQNIEKFRTHLKTTFKTIKNLNSAFGMKAVDFKSIYPPLSDDSSKNVSLWNEWRIHNDNIVSDGYKMYKKAVLDVDPKGTISVSGTQGATPFDGFDWSKLSKHFGTMQGYSGGDQDRKRMSFTETQMINATPAGYGRSGRAVDYQVWSTLINSSGGHVLFWWIAFRNPDLTFCQSALDYQRVFKEMKRGMGRQYLRAQRVFSPVGILYSMNSMRAAYLHNKEYITVTNKASKEIVALGYDPIYISEEEVANGGLKKKGIKALFMPATYSLGRGVLGDDHNVEKALISFTKNKGLLFASDLPTLNEYLRPATLKPALKKAVSLYKTIDTSIFKKLISGGITPYVTLSGPKEKALKLFSLAVHEFKDEKKAKLVTVLRPPVGSKEVLGGDGVVHVVPDKTGGNKIEKVTVDLSELNPAFVYDMRAKKELTLKKGRLSLDVLAGDGYPLALLPYRVEGVTSTVQIKDNNLLISWDIKAKTNTFAPHVLRVSIGTKGAGEDRTLSLNVTSTKQGKGSVVVPLALEDTGRTLEIRLADILSGVQSKKKELLVP